MSYTTPVANDLATFLGVEVSIDTDRATFIIGLAEKLAQSVVTPLPDGAEAVVLDVAVRAYGNPQNLAQQNAGPFAAGFGAVGGGLWLTSRNIRNLRRLNGGGGAFTVDTIPDTAGTGLPWWDVAAPVDGFDVP